MIPVVLPTYGRADVAFERGEGAYLWSSDGRRFLDFGAGVAVTNLGHCHPKLVETLQNQAAKLWHVSNHYTITGQEKVAAKLVANSFADTVFFCNSGAEANECAIKMARRYQFTRGQGQRNQIICASGAFHGRTLGTIAAGGQEKYLEGFEPRLPGFVHVPFGNMNAMRDALSEHTAAILVEPVQGESGVIPGDPDYLRRLRAAADEFGALLVFDEVQTGMGRTAKLFAYEHAGVTPDIMSLAKGLGGGFPVGACLATEKAAAGMGAGTHGSTFGGNPLAMAVTESVLDCMLEAGFMDKVAANAALLRQRLEALCARFPAVIEEVRGLGMMIGLKCKGSNIEMVTRLRNNGLLLIPAGDNVARLLPPLIIGEAEIAEALTILEKTFAEVTP
ncbi:aspartate aminotransferase family protein [Magnetospirillum sp. 64-120]|uniref:aspartate aminotransferase family protein n=1 Tax=Magnetospirillum sp. 64-120 TaxID=1895778 RepID=UPI00092B129E|nr:aspartate aminotransferase family protein [Magnetospirillum sp. 64-120]OJX68259.1 MAG: acetylornithine transaminase [Magnetospirillum sp. 64-120]